MKLSFIFLTALYVNVASAVDSTCATKEMNIASYALAQEFGVKVQTVEVIEFNPGSSTEANFNFSLVTVKAPNKISKNMIIKRYIVNSIQFGTTDDCEIKSISEDTLSAPL